ncbi:MAG: hypothetical protein WBL68_09000 [Nitrososphaeraceae archaeon]
MLANDEIKRYKKKIVQDNRYGISRSTFYLSAAEVLEYTVAGGTTPLFF